MKILNKKSVINLAKYISHNVEIRDIIILKGDLGSGKTFFAKNFINNFHIPKINVISPSFNIVQTYETKSFTIWHFDLYRLKSIEEAYNVGIEQAFEDAVSLIEWPQLVEDIIHIDFLEINFEFADNDSERLVSIIPHGKWKNFFKYGEYNE